MHQGAATTPPDPEGGLREARAEITRELGRDTLAELHRQDPLLDALAVGGSLAIFLALAWALAHGGVRDWWWWACLLLQGDMVLVLAMVNHDVFAHRKWLPPRPRWFLSSLLAWPSQLRPSAYEEHHLSHHRTLGTPLDPESYKHGLDTRWRRFLFATPAMLVQHALLVRRVGQAAKASPRAQNPALAERATFESRARWAITAAVAAAAVWDWRLVVYGYLVPLVFVMPALNTVRIVLEHFDLDTRNPFWTGTFYRTGPLTRTLFWWIGGDCHVVHHFYATIPWYRLPRAIRLIRPILLRNGVHEHHSLPRLLADWFAARRPHWSVPAGAQASPRA